MGELKYPLSIVVRAVDQATKPLQDINKQLSRIGAPFKRLSNSFGRFSEALGLPKVQESFGKFKEATAKVGSEVFALGAKFAALSAAAGLAFYGIVKSAVDAGDKLGEMAQRVGLSVDAYAQLQFAAAQADVDQEQFNSSMDRFNKSLGEAKAGTGSLLAFLTRVSPALARQVRGAKTTEQAFGLMTKAFEKVTDPGKRAALAAAAFGKSGLQMGQFLGQGSAAIDEQRRKFFELAGSQKEFAKGAGDLDNAMRETEVAFLGLRNTAAGALFPALTELSKALSAVIAGNRGKLAEWAKTTGDALSAWVQGGGLERLTVSLRDIAVTVGTVVEKLGGLKGVAIAVGAVMSAPLVSALAGFAGAAFNLGSTVLPILIRGASLLWPAIASVGTAVWGALAPLAPFAAAAAPFIAAAVGIGAVAYQIYKNWDDLKLIFSEWWVSIKETFAKGWETIRPIVEALSKVGGFSPVGLVSKGVSFVGEKLFGAAEPSRPSLNVERPAALAAGTQKTEARVMVDFANMPKGVRVSPAKENTAPLDLSLGYSMVGGQ